MHGSGMDPDRAQLRQQGGQTPVLFNDLWKNTWTIFPKLSLFSTSGHFLGNILLNFFQQISMAESNHLARLSDKNCTLYEHGDFTYYRFHFSF